MYIHVYNISMKKTDTLQNGQFHHQSTMTFQFGHRLRSYGETMVSQRLLKRANRFEAS